MSGEVGTPAVHANTAGDAARGVPMPEVPQHVERMRASDLARGRREGTLATRAPQPQEQQRDQRTLGQTSAREHIAQKSHELEAKPEQEQPSLADAEGQQNELDENGQPQEGQEGVEASSPAALADAEAAAKYREWQQSDLYPEELAGKMHEVTVRGQKRYVDTAELRQGYIRHSDYTARGKELAQREESVTQYRSSMDQHFEAIKDPEQFLEIYERNGYGDTLEQVAERVAARREEHRSIVIAAGRSAAERAGFTAEQIRAGEADKDRRVYEAMEKADARLRQARAVEIENRKLSAQHERVQSETAAAKQAAETAALHENYTRQIGQLRPGAFAAFGIRDTPQNRTAFMRHLGDAVSMAGGINNDGITREHVMNAGRVMKEELEDKMERERSDARPEYLSPAEWRAKQQAEARAQALSPKRTGTGGGKPLQPQQSASLRASDFEKMRREKRLGQR